MIKLFRNIGSRVHKAICVLSCARYKIYKLCVTALTGLFGLQANTFAADISLGAGSSFFTTAISTLQVLVIALGVGLGAWGVINLLEGYGNDNPGAKSQGMKQLMAGAGVAVVGAVLIPQLSSLFGSGG